MRTSGFLTATAIGAVLVLAPAATTAQTPAAPPTAAAPAATPAVDPAAVEALEKMSAYLRLVQSFEMKADVYADMIIEGDRKAQLSSTVTYKVRKPNAFTIDITSDRKIRKYYYDGKTLTVSAPRGGYYAQVSAPATIRETVDALNNKGIEVPLEDLFRWGMPGDARDELDAGIYVGPARINGVETDQYAFSTGDVDWQIWIKRGPQPVPVRIVISDETDVAKPQFQANLSWNTTATFTDADFKFTPPADAKAITFAATGVGGQ